MLFIGLLFTLTNCEKEDNEEFTIQHEIPVNELFQTVSIDETLDFFEKIKGEKGLYAKADDPIGLEPDLDNITQEDLFNTDVQITVIPAETNFSEINTRILQVKTIDGRLVSLLFNEIPDPTSTYDDFSGIINLTTLSGEIIDAYRVVNGNAISYFEKKLTYATDCDENLNPFSDFCFQQLNEIIITGSSYTANVNRQLSNNSGPIYPSYVWRYANNGYYSYGTSYLNYLRSLPCEDANKIRNFYGTCVDKPPCPGDPVKNPEIAPQKNSGIDGGLHGTCTRSGEICNGISGLKIHDGVDLKNPYGAPIYAMYDGTARLATQYNEEGEVIKAGHHVSITSTVNGNTVRLVYFHMQQNSRVSGIVNAGDIIGYQGASGNLKAAIEQKLTVSHLHVKARVNGSVANPLNYLSTKIDPNTGKVTNPCQ